MSGMQREWEISPTFFDQVKDMTSDLFRELIGKWRMKYPYSNELLDRKLNKFLQFLKESYEEIAESEEEKRIDLINTIDNKMYQLHKLKKDLHLPVDEDASWNEILKPHVVLLAEVEENLKKYEEMKQERLKKYNAVREQEKELCEILEIPELPEFPDPIPSDSQLEEVESHIFHLREERINRIESFKESRERIIGLLKEMELDIQHDFEIEIISSNENTFKPTTSNMNNLKALKSRLEHEYEQKWSYRESLIEKLQRLWNRINFEPAEGEAFLQKYPSVSKSHIKALNDEIARCEEIKLANIKPIIEKLRVELIEMWDLLTFSESQRNEFEPFTSQHFSEDILDLHELEILKLKIFYDKYRNIYELAEKRNELWQRMLHLDEIAMDKSRLFNNRGGQLLKEEKERKSLEVNVPKVDKQLKSALLEFEQNEGHPFLWHGENLFVKVTKEWAERQEAKENKKLARIMDKIREIQVENKYGSSGYYRRRTPCKKVENQKQIEVEAKLGARLTVQKRKMGTPIANVSEAKARRCDLGQTIVLKGGGVRTPGRLPTIRTPLNISTASIASYSHFQSDLNQAEMAADSGVALSSDLIKSDFLEEPDHQDGLEKPELVVATPRTALKEVGNRVPGIGHSSPTLTTPAGRKGTPASACRSNPSTIPRMATHRTRLHLDF